MAAPTGAGPPTAVGSSSSSAAVRAVISRLNESIKATLAHQKPWSELVDRSSFAKPDSVAEASNRVKKNLKYFFVNYAIFLVFMMGLSMLMSPWSIFWLFALTVMWGYVLMIRTEPIVISGRILSDREKAIALLLITVFVVFGLTSVGAILISGFIVGAAVVVGHASLRVPDDLFLDDNDGGTGKLFAFLNAPMGPGQLPSVSHV
eukprot:TRINITY_DN143_c0_g1_i1.p1 TRINITY_DN143_c0_g1~~TRINITY_DN143_c0_g1_i1.p1  ORF type:complete len:205 (-),score=15.19 TRINITY_DN143_c0_g1_i1:578-1192(-)